MHLPSAAPLALWPPLLAVHGPGDTSRGHAHHAIHAVIARGGSLRTTIDGVTHAAAGIVTPPDLPHAIDASGLDVILLFIDPESDVGARLRNALAGRPRLLDAGATDELIDRLSASPGTSELAQWMPVAAQRLAGGTAERPAMHPKVRRLLKRLREGGLDTSLEALATDVGLSPSRLMHVFTASVGIPLRPYLRWIKIQRAATAIVHGAPLAQAALDAGFTDAAHMSRTFVRMFGLPPSMLVERRSQSVQAASAHRSHVRGES